MLRSFFGYSHSGQANLPAVSDVDFSSTPNPPLRLSEWLAGENTIESIITFVATHLQLIIGDY
ncbi:MAG: hypothetical protein HUJ26_14335 [Planctomycetaceae bacterium]|nr:hypothetical protein [Planctomycetaceae bacterium]